LTLDSFSVTMSVYRNDNPAHFALALDSIVRQTAPPDEIVLTVDGPVPAELDELIQRYEQALACLKVIRLPENRGQGIAHRVGVEHCAHELVAIMDADDIAVPERFEKQLAAFRDDPELDIVGGYITEFMENPDETIAIRRVPLTDASIKSSMRRRCPMNHVTVMFKKRAVVDAGNYQDFHFNEDYYLWCRMLLAGRVFANLPETLVKVRVGNGMYARRGGWAYFRSEARLQRFLRDKRVIGVVDYCVNVAVRFVVQVLMPGRLRAFVFRRFFREKA